MDTQDKKPTKVKKKDVKKDNKSTNNKVGKKKQEITIEEIGEFKFQQPDFHTQLEQNKNLVKKHTFDLKPKQKIKKYEFLKYDSKIPTDLPVLKILKDIGESVEKNQITIVKASTGSGKSLGIPPYFVNKGYIVRVSLPTIPATLGLYKFVKENAFIKNDVGYSCYGDVCYDRMTTKLAFCTTKHLINDMKLVLNGTKQLPSNFLLMIDEAHHTSTENKVILKLALHMIKKGINIKLIIASATLGEMNFSNYSCKTIQSSGRMYPITIHWNDKDIDPVDMKKAVIYTTNKVIDVIKESKERGDYKGILVFVPGEAEVETIALQLESLKELNLAVFRLYSNMPSEEIMDAFAKIPEGTIKVVISTNIGESSITIPDICKVIDMGLQKTPYDARIGMKLITDFAPKDKLTQRKGRAGRTSDGDYYPMFTEKKWGSFRDTDLSDMDRILPYMIVLEFLDAGLNAQEILEMDDARYNPLVEKLIRLNLIDKNNKITNLGHAVPNYPFSLENAIVAYRALDLIYKGEDKNNLERDDPAVVAILIIIAMLEGSQGNSFFWIPKEHRKTSATKQVFMNDKYKNLKGDTDFATFINIFASMMHDSNGSTAYSYVKWAQDNSMNNKLLANVRKHFRRLLEMTYGLTQNEIDGSVEKQAFNMLKSFYGIHNLSQLTDLQIMNTVYNLFEEVYSDCTFEEPVEVGKKKLLHYHHNIDGTKYRIDGFRSFSKMESVKMHRLIALQVIETKNGQMTTRYISCLFPSKDQTEKDNGSDWESCSTNGNFSMNDIDFSMLGDIEDFADFDEGMN